MKPTLIGKYFADASFANVVSAWIAAAIVFALPTEGHRLTAVLVVALVGCDTVLGLWTAFATGRRLQSAKLIGLVSKLLVYSSAIVLVTSATKALGASEAHAPMVAITLGWMMGREALSIIEKFDRLGYRLPDALQKLIRERFDEKIGGTDPDA